MSTTIYLALNSVSFCNHYLNMNLKDEPLMDEITFMKGWGYLVIIVSVYTLVFHSEKYDRKTMEPEHEVTSISEILKISINLILNKNMLLLVSLFIAERALCSVVGFVGQMYLLDEKEYSQENYSFITLLLFPLNILISLLSAKISHERPLMMYFWSTVARVVTELLLVNVLFYNYDEIMSYSPMLFDISLFWLMLVSEFCGT